MNFNRTSPVAHLIPPANTFISHPIDWISQCVQVFKLHTQRTSEETAERRRKKVEDVEKRRRYRKAHGLEKDQASESTSLDDSEGVYSDFEGRRRPIKKWFGIW